MQISFDKNNLYTKVWCVVYRILLDICYIKFVVPHFEYSGFTLHFSFLNYILSVVLLFFGIWMFGKFSIQISFSKMIMLFLILISFIPFTSMVGLYSFTIEYVVANTVYWMVLSWLMVSIPTINIPPIKRDRMLYIILLVVVAIFAMTVVYISWRYTGFRLTFDIFNVYTIRRESATFNMPKILEYIFAATKAVNPILLLFFLSIRKRGIAAIIFGIQILSFSINGSKTVLVSTVISVFFFYIYKERMIKRLPLIMTCMMLLGLVEELFSSSLITTFLIRRVMFLPNLLNFNYFDFFTTHEPDYFGQSFLRYFGASSHYPEIDHMIGRIYYGKTSMGANNGLISDAFANLGWVGIFIMPLLLVFVMRLLDASVKGLETRIYVVSAITISFILISSFLLTTLLTHGLLVIIVILFVLPRKDINNGG